MSLLTITAGADAYQKIQRDGLCANDIDAVFAASGAAKWLSIYGLDHAIFTRWFAGRQRELLLYGTSVGAFKLAAACHTDAGAGFEALAQRYIYQNYQNGTSVDDVEQEFKKILDAVLRPEKVKEILLHPTFRFSCSAVRCHGSLGSDDLNRQRWSMLAAAFKNIGGRHGLQKDIERIVFRDVRSEFPFFSGDGYSTKAIALNQKNLQPAVKASGSIPVFMHGVKNIPGAGSGVFRDGGLLDYHPVPGNLWNSEGLILYPHFYSSCKEGWFDKLLPWRKTNLEKMKQVVMVSPSQKFLDQLKLGRIPDRHDFKRFAKDDKKRIELWQDVVTKSHLLGEEFMALSGSGKLADHVLPMK